MQYLFCIYFFHWLLAGHWSRQYSPVPAVLLLLNSVIQEGLTKGLTSSLVGIDHR